TKEGHWSGTLTSPRTFGHFGGSGTFLWVDPDRRIACAALTTRPFGDWAKEEWPRLSAAVLRELGSPRPPPRYPSSSAKSGRSSSSKVARSQLATTDGSIAVTV